MRYKVGDKIRLKPDCKDTYEWCVNGAIRRAMTSRQIMTITVVSDGYVNVDEMSNATCIDYEWIDKTFRESVELPEELFTL